MVFAAFGLLGIVAWLRMPVELLPPLTGDSLYVAFARPGSEPEVVERELLAPLEARLAELSGLRETRAEIRGSTGTLTVQLERGADVRVRELQLRQIAAEIARTQPRGTVVEVSSFDLSVLSQVVLFVQVLGGADQNALRDLAEQRIVPRLVAVPGVGRVQAAGGTPLEARVELDPDRCAALGVRPEAVVQRLSEAVGRLRYVGSADAPSGRTAIVVDARPRGPVSLGEVGVGNGVRLGHVADVALGPGRPDALFRVDGRPAIGLVVFKEQGANLVRLGRALRDQLDALGAELAPLGIRFVINTDAAKIVEDQLVRLRSLALSGFAIALMVLLLFVRQVRAVFVLGIAVPASLLLALALLYVAGLSINLITLFGLAVAVGMLVDNSIVVYEATQRLLERGLDPDRAAAEAVRRTLRAILAATLTNAVVFLPLLFVEFDDRAIAEVVSVLARAYVVPQLASLLVAAGLVPLLARRFAAPAALRSIDAARRRRALFAGIAPPDRARELFTGLLTVALRRPAGWLAGTAAAVLVTAAIAVPWVALSSAGSAPQEADEVRIQVELPGSTSLEQAAHEFERLEQAAATVPGVATVESYIQEGSGSLQVKLVERARRPPSASAARVREVVDRTARDLPGVEIVTGGERDGGGGGGGGGRSPEELLGEGPAEIVLSGPDARQLVRLADDIRSGLRAIPEVGEVTVGGRAGPLELHVTPDPVALAARGLMADEALSILGAVRREGIQLRAGLTLEDGREVALTVRRPRTEKIGIAEVSRLPLTLGSSVVPLGAIASVTRMPAEPPILRHDGRREIAVRYALGWRAPESGPARLALDERIRAAIRALPRPAGYTLEAKGAEERTNWFRRVAVPAVLLLFGVLAVAFESLTLPLLILLALPLTLIGAAWALVFAGMSAGMMALVGAVALLGLTVNPAILLVDRMQERVRGGASVGAAALASVRERVRPVLMTTATTVAGLWPLALQTGAENEIWPPFATVVMGGLVASTALTLLVTPVGFVLLRRLDVLFGRIGPWLVLGWLAATALVVTPLFATGLIESLTWQVVTLGLVAGVWLGAIVIVLARRPVPEPVAPDGGPPPLEVRFLHKVYGRPGPLGQAWRAPEAFARRVLARGGRPFDPRRALARMLPLGLCAGGALYLAMYAQSTFWRVVFAYVVALLITRLLIEARRARGRADASGRVDPGGIEHRLAALAPWLAWAWTTVRFWVVPYLAREVRPSGAGEWTWFLLVPVLFAGVIAVTQLGRRTALALARGTLPARTEGRFRRTRNAWRRLARRVFGLDLPVREVPALVAAEFRVEHGMVGVLGPNGAGKTTLLRQIAGILEPSHGTIRFGGVRIEPIRRVLARWVGYLPQEFGLPQELTAREYLELFGLLYGIRPAAERRERIARLLDEVGLGGRADEPIGRYSGGMKQRVAVARTLLRLPAVIVVDEPTVGLDPRERIRFRNLLARLARGRIVLFSTHVVEDVAVACERVIVLAAGRIVYDGAPAGLADVARDRTWTVHLAAGEEPDWPAGALVTDQVPEVDGATRCRVLATGRPHPRAEAVPPSLEDGYLLLVQGERAHGRAA
jgi:multidrug efflux pump subunit AcrB/ABC-type multidrug transport system ATPase subunit